MIAHAATLAVPPSRPAASRPISPDIRTDIRAFNPQVLTIAQYEVPNVSGQTLPQALAELAAKGFKTDARASDGTTAGERVVVGTRPPAGSRGPVTQRPVVVVLHRAATAQQPQPSRTVPVLVGRTCEDAVALLRRLDMRLAGCTPGAATGREKPGLINAQDPRPGAPMPSDRTMRAFVEPAPPEVRVEVPDVRGRQAPDAQRTLRAARLEAVGIEPAQNNEWHVVQQQEPLPPARVAPGSRVRLIVVGRYVVPLLAGLSCEAAREAARARGFADLACRDEDGGASAQEGRVFRQNMAANTVLAAPQPLAVAVHKPAPVTVPDVTGAPIEQARERVRQAQLVPVVTGPTARQGLRVRSQTPDAGTAVARGSRVTLTTLLTVPDLRGLGCDEATARARAYGFAAVRCEERAPNVPGDLRTGTVFFQSPPVGQALPEPVSLSAHIVAPAIVPDVQGQALGAAQRAIAQAGLRAVPDVTGGGADREVTAQSPAAQARVPRGSDVRLGTVRMVAVPALTGRSCADGQRDATALGLQLQCNVVNAEAFTWLAPVIESQDLAVGTRVREGSVLQAQARAPMPWLALALGAGALLAGGLAAKPIMARLAARRTPPPPAPPAGPAFGIRGEPDMQPSVAVSRVDDAVDEPARRNAGLAVRAQPGNWRLFVRGVPDNDGADHD
jgi:beta-lactam-binding protein with PASTA domain